MFGSSLKLGMRKEILGVFLLSDMTSPKVSMKSSYTHALVESKPGIIRISQLPFFFRHKIVRGLTMTSGCGGLSAQK